MSLVPFYKKPITFLCIIMIINLVIRTLTNGLYFSPENETAVALNLFMGLAIELLKIGAIAFCIIKLFQAKLTEKFIKTVIYYITYIIATFLIAMPIISLCINTWLSKNANNAGLTAKYLTAYLGSHDYILNIQNGSLSLKQAILCIAGSGMLFIVYGVIYFYVMLKIANKITSYFVSNSEEAA